MKQRIIDAIIDREGGYVDDPKDSGGETNHGITFAVARDYGFTGKMEYMPRALAFEIYAKRYWDSVRADSIAFHSEMIAEEVVDTAVNMGNHRAGLFLQRSLNVFNKNQKLYCDVVVDGKIGNRTIAALERYLSNRDESVLLMALNCLQGSYYITLAERRQKDERFVYGWLKNRVAL